MSDIYICRWDEEPSMEDPDVWIDPTGGAWDLDLNISYRDVDGFLWHWSGGLVSEHDRGFGYVPIMSRNDWKIIDLSLSDCPHPMKRWSA